jgi:hypothetical protein
MSMSLMPRSPAGAVVRRPAVQQIAAPGNLPVREKAGYGRAPEHRSYGLDLFFELIARRRAPFDSPLNSSSS